MTESHEDVLAAWLGYCRTVVRDTGHRGACGVRGGSLDGDPDGRGRLVYSGARWPGYLGRAYRAGGLLWVNIVHEDLGQRGLRQEADGYARATTRWRDADPVDTEEDIRYLAAQRAMYSAGLARWNVGRLIDDVAVRTLDTPLTSLAYVNAARCQVLTRADGGNGPVQNALVRYCQQWLPVSVVVGALRPSMVIMTSAALLAQTECRWPGVMTVGLSQRYRVLNGSPWRPRSADWRGDLAQDWREFTTRRPDARACSTVALDAGGRARSTAANFIEVPDP